MSTTDADYFICRWKFVLTESLQMLVATSFRELIQCFLVRRQVARECTFHKTVGNPGWHCYTSAGTGHIKQCFD